MKRLVSVITAFMVFSSLWAGPKFLVDGYGSFSYPIIPDSSKTYLGEMNPAFMGGAGLEVRPFKNFGVTFHADFSNYTSEIDGVSSAFYTDLTFGAKGILPLGNRFELYAGAKAGFFIAEKQMSFGGISAGGILGADFRITPVISLTAGLSYTGFINSKMPLHVVNGFAGIRINLNNMFSRKGNLGVEVSEMTPVFPVLYSWYNDNSFGVLEIFNQEESDITQVKLSFYQEEYMTTPKVYETIPRIKKGQSESVELTAFFNENILTLIEPVNKNALVTIDYKLLGERRSLTVPVSVAFLNRNNMSWDDDRRASVFVSPNDSEAMSFAKQVKSAVRPYLDSGKSESLQLAMAVFESLSIYGLNYVIDPASSYAANVGSTSVDFLQFPYQTLNYRGGDCDDLSILYCSLLEALGIEGAFITVPGHIYTGICLGNTSDEKAFGDGPVLENGLVYYEGKIWKPLEITMLKDGFSKAADFGITEWQKYIDEARIWPIHSNWELYSSVSSPEKKSEIILPAKETLVNRFREQQRLLPEIEGVEE